MNLGPTEILVILVVALVLFGPSKLPELGKSLGKGIREFKRGTQGLKDELEISLKEEPARPQAQQPVQTPMPQVQSPAEAGPAATEQTVYSAAPQTVQPGQPAQAAQSAPLRASDLAVDPVVQSPVEDAAGAAKSAESPHRA